MNLCGESVNLCELSVNLCEESVNLCEESVNLCEDMAFGLVKAVIGLEIGTDLVAKALVMAVPTGTDVNTFLEAVMGFMTPCVHIKSCCLESRCLGVMTVEP